VAAKPAGFIRAVPSKWEETINNHRRISCLLASGLCVAALRVKPQAQEIPCEYQDALRILDKQGDF